MVNGQYQILNIQCLLLKVCFMFHSKIFLMANIQWSMFIIQCSTAHVHCLLFKVKYSIINFQFTITDIMHLFARMVCIWKYTFLGRIVQSYLEKKICFKVHIYSSFL